MLVILFAYGVVTWNQLVGFQPGEAKYGMMEWATEVDSHPSYSTLGMSAAIVILHIHDKLM